MTVPHGQPTGREAWSPLEECSLENTMALVGTKSAIMIMREAYCGTTRFNDFCRRIGVTRSAAATRLNELVAAGLLRRQPYREAGQRTRDEYVLTAVGLDFMPVVWAMIEWAQRHMPRHAPLRLTHHGCGADARVEIRCDRGHHVPSDELTVERLKNRATTRRQRTAT